jgi:hypothetical protein
MTALAAPGAGSVTTGGSLIDARYETYVDCGYKIADAYRNQNSPVG